MAPKKTRNATTARIWLPALLGVFALAGQAGAWHGSGHDLASRKGLSLLTAKQAPAFLRGSADAVAHTSLDPDLFTQPIGPEQLHRAERSEHYLDLENFTGSQLPRDRYDLLAWCVKNDVPPHKMGFLPYAITEWTQRLTVALAEHRKWPDNPHIRRKVLVYAGILAHYAADLTVPLHTTIHYDGRVGADGKSPRSGIHMKTDALLGKLPDDVPIPARPGQAKPMDDVFDEVVAALKASHARLDRLYELEKQIPDYDGPLDADSDVGRFTRDRLNDAALLIARLITTAWRDSASIEMPKWHRRPARAATQTTAPATRPLYEGGGMTPVAESGSSESPNEPGDGMVVRQPDSARPRGHSGGVAPPPMAGQRSHFASRGLLLAVLAVGAVGAGVTLAIVFGVRAARK